MQTISRPAAVGESPTRVYFCAWMAAGWRTQYENVRSVAGLDERLSIQYIEIDPYRAGGFIERMPFLSNRIKGSLRSFVCTLPLFREEPMDVLWSQADTALFPFLATRARYAAIPYVISTDATHRQIEQFEEYGLGDSRGGQSLKHRLRDRMLAFSYRHAALVLPCSHWAARAIAEEYGVLDERIRVIPPGVDLRRWPMGQKTPQQLDAPLRLLFVGGDFNRKGGPLLLEVFREHLRGQCELHLVTRDGPVEEPGVFVYRNLGPNDPALKTLYQTCDAFVLPTRADCFSIASIEAMASGLPVITCPVGGIPEIIEEGESGWLVPVGDGQTLLAAIETLLAERERGRRMGRRGRDIVEERFDAAKNNLEVFDLLHDIRRRSVSARSRHE